MVFAPLAAERQIVRRATRTQGISVTRKRRFPMSGMLGTGLPIAAEAFDLELYQTACIFTASSELARLSKDQPGLVRVANTFQQSEASRHLISLAAMIRSAMDTWSATAAKHLSAPVGDWQSNMENPNETV